MASHPSPVEHIAVNFSSDAIAQADTKCQGSKCNNIIRAGEKRLYAGNANPNKPGRFVCMACFTRYRSQPTTVRRTVSVQEIRAQPSIDRESISGQINAAQREGAHTPRGRVTAMPASSSNLFRHSFHLPDVVNPSSFGSSSSVSQAVPSGYLTPPLSNPAPFGYSPAHASYALERVAWQDASIRGKAPRLTKQVLAILVDVYYEVRDQSTDIMDEDPTPISEGTIVDYYISPQDLMHTMFTTILPELQIL